HRAATRFRCFGVTSRRAKPQSRDRRCAATTLDLHPVHACLLLRLLRRLLGLLLGSSVLLPFFQFLAFVGDLHIRSESLVILVLLFFHDPYVVGRKMQRVVGVGIDGKTVLPIDLLAPGSKLGKEVFLSLLLANIGHSLTKGFYDLEVLIIHPD